MPYEEDKLQGVTEDETLEKRRFKKKPLSVLI
jgi:hypothetical protein